MRCCQWCGVQGCGPIENRVTFSIREEAVGCTCSVSASVNLVAVGIESERGFLSGEEGEGGAGRVPESPGKDLSALDALGEQDRKALEQWVSKT